MSGKYNTKWFIEKAKKVHGDLYDYSLVEYKNSQTKISIICNIHGVFQQRPNDHTSHKHGCPLCGSKKLSESLKLSKDDILEKFYKVHGDKYKYDSFEYSGTYVKSTIKCEKHGSFKMNATNHLLGRGCKQCTKESLNYNRGGLNVIYVSKEVFLERALKRHGSKYDYSNMEYVDFNTAVTIRCNKHNKNIKQVPKNHLNNKGGCLDCKKEATSETFLKTTEDFIKIANDKHQNFYTYKKSKYKCSKTPLIITCPVHGDFEQRPNDHLTGHGCSKCGYTGSTYNITKANRNKEEWSNKVATLYLTEFKSKTENFIKIGISNEKALRYSVLERESNCRIVESLEFETDLYSAVIIEQTIINNMKPYRYAPNNKFRGYTECFELKCRNPILTDIINYLEEDGKD